MNRNLKQCIINQIKQGKILKLNHSKQLYIKKIYEIAEFDVWLVNGQYIRKNICEDFVNFDQHFHLNFIPKNEIWIDDDIISARERKFILLHEMHERNLMQKGKTYQQAHKSATEIEDYCRHNPKMLDKKLKLEINKQE